MIIFVEGRDLPIFWWHFFILLFKGASISPSYYFHFLFHILLCLEVTNRILQSVICILVLNKFSEDMTFKDMVGFVVFHFFTKGEPLSNYKKCFSLDHLLLPKKESYEIGYVCPFISPSRKFIIIDSLDFSETWHCLRDPYMVALDRFGFFSKISIRQKW